MAIPAAEAVDIIGPEPFGKTAAGEPVMAYTLKNANGIVAKVMTRGATLTELHVPDKKGKTADVVLGFDSLAGYESDANQYFGCTTGRVANRIAKGKFTLDGKEYKLAVNNGPNHLHGGEKKSLDKVVWKATISKTVNMAFVHFTYTSPDGEEGYPGKVDFKVSYALSDKNELLINYSAKTDAATPINLTNHSYFNLAGAGAGTVLDHELTVFADKYTPVDETLIPTGKLEPVENTPLDFRKAKRVGDGVEKLIKTPALGLDHNFVIRTIEKNKTPPAAILRDPASGRVMKVTTTQPGVQVYSGNFLKGQKGKGDKVYKQRSALCLETQHFPDAVNHPNFPSIILQPGKPYAQTTVFTFSAE